MCPSGLSLVMWGLCEEAEGPPSQLMSCFPVLVGCELQRALLVQFHRLVSSTSSRPGTGLSTRGPRNHRMVCDLKGKMGR